MTLASMECPMVLLSVASIFIWIWLKVEGPMEKELVWRSGSRGSTSIGDTSYRDFVETFAKYPRLAHICCECFSVLSSHRCELEQPTNEYHRQSGQSAEEDIHYL